MSHLVRHRGPDGLGLWSSPSGAAFLGHRRLSIIDLALGAQPMSDPTGRYTISFNGEIFNYVELREELAAEGVQFRTRSDTEVLLQLCMRMGAACLDRLAGQFAFAFWDEDARTLMLARDPVGEKPLYYSVQNDCLYFSSTFASLRGTATEPTRIDYAALDAFLNLGYVPAPATIDRAISKLDAGTVLIAGPGGVRVNRYASFDAVEPFEGSETQAVERLDELLRTAVRLRLRSDVPLGFFLSGGVDSSLVSAIASNIAPNQIHTFSISYHGTTYDESGYAAAVADRIGASHHCFRVTEDLIGLIPEMVRQYGEPFGDSSALPLYLLARETREHVTVVLTGDGGDEGFGGYNWYETARRLRKAKRFVLTGVARAGASLFSDLDAASPRMRRLARGMGMLVLDDANRFAALRAYISPIEARQLYAGELAAVRADGVAASTTDIADRYTRSDGSPLRRMRKVDVETYLADCMLPKVDVATMAHALEARPPLLDRDLLAFALGLPDRFLFRNGDRKWLLKRALGRYLPLRLFDRPKQGFTVPISDWFRRALRPAVEGLAASEPLLDTGWFRSDGIRAIVAEHAAGQREHSDRLYNLLVLDEWLRQS
jgi:asparagine synthase (glutamine-hydrolysing)